MQTNPNQSETKTCSKCQTTKSIEEFTKSNTIANGRQYYCKSCCKAYRMANIKDIAAYNKEWRTKNKDKVANCPSMQSEYRKTRAEQYYIDNMDRIKQSTLLSQRKYKKDPFYRLVANIRVLMTFSIPKEHYNTPSMELIGCTKEELKQHIANQFIGKMKWENYGTVWQLDHVIARSKFDFNKVEEQKLGFNYINLQPLFTKDNQCKHARIIHNEKSCVVLDKLLKIRSK